MPPRSLLAPLTLSLMLAMASAAVAQAPGGGQMPPLPVVTAKAVLREMSNKIEAIGTTRANESIEIRAKVSGIATEIHFEDGQEVKAGEVLAKLDSKYESAARKEAQAGLLEQKREYSRVTKLVKQEAAPGSRLEASEARLKQAQASLEANLARLDDRKIIAPFDGILGLRRISPGALVTPETVITTLDDLSTIKLDFTVPEVYLDSVAVGMTIEARSPAFEGKSFTGTVSAVDTRIDPVTRAFTVRSLVPNPDLTLKPGMLMTVHLITSNKERLVVPESALAAEKEKQFVLRVKADQTVEKREVALGHRYPGWVEVVSGIDAGDEIITEGTQKARNGAKVQPMGAGKPAAEAKGEE